MSKKEKLRLVYISGCYNKRKVEVNLSGKYNIKKNKKNQIEVEMNCQINQEFWGRHISDCCVLVGENGAGKTQVLRFIMEICKGEKNGVLDGFDNLIVIYENAEGDQLYYYSKMDLKFEANINIKQLDKIAYKKIRETYCIAYNHKALSSWDYTEFQSCDYNFSVGSSIQNYYIKPEKIYIENNDKIFNYFHEQNFKIIKFLYDSEIIKQKKIKFPKPDHITITALSSIEDKIIINTLKHYDQSLKNDIERNKQTKIIEKNLDLITDGCTNKWIKNITKNLIINSIVEIINQETINSYQTKYKNIWNTFLSFPRTYDINNIRNMAESWFENNCSSINAKKYIDFLEWMQKNECEISKYTSQNKLVFPLIDNTRKIIIQLMENCARIGFCVPNLAIDFGISSGEYVFISLFADLYSMCDGTEKNVLLLLDEPDVTLHPRWQRNFMFWLTEFINNYFDNKNVQIVMTTHSPILLSDFPAHNVLYLMSENKKIIGRKDIEKRTFGCNIHTLFLDSFFLENEGTMGRFAEEKINKLIDKVLSNANGLTDDTILTQIELVGDNIIRNKLEQICNRSIQENKKIEYSNENMQGKAIELLKKQRDEINILLRQLEKQ